MDFFYFSALSQRLFLLECLLELSCLWRNLTRANCKGLEGAIKVHGLMRRGLSMSTSQYDGLKFVYLLNWREDTHFGTKICSIKKDIGELQ